MPAAHGPISAATCGITPESITSSRNRWPEPANSDPTASWIRAPAESSSQIIGIRLVSASSRSRVDLELAGHPHRAGHHGEVVGGDRGQPAVDLAVAGDHSVRRRLRRPSPAGRSAAGRGSRARRTCPASISSVDPLARGQLLGGVLGGDLLRAAAELDPLPPRRADRRRAGAAGWSGRRWPCRKYFRRWRDRRRQCGARALRIVLHSVTRCGSERCTTAMVAAAAIAGATAISGCGATRAISGGEVDPVAQAATTTAHARGYRLSTTIVGHRPGRPRCTGR